MRFHKVSFETGKQQLIYVITHYSTRQFSNPAAALPQAGGSSNLPLAARGERPGWALGSRASSWASLASRGVTGFRDAAEWQLRIQHGNGFPLLAALLAPSQGCCRGFGVAVPSPRGVRGAWGLQPHQHTGGGRGEASPRGRDPPCCSCPSHGGLGKERGGSAALWGKRRQRHKGKPESIKYF